MNRYLLSLSIIALCIAGYVGTSMASTLTADDVAYPVMVAKESNNPSATPSSDNAPAEIYGLSITPGRVSVGSYPAVAAIIHSKTTVSGPGKGVAVLNIKAVVTFPDGTTKSWWWNKFSFAPNQFREIKLPKEYDIKQPGTYKVEYFVYNANKSKIYDSRLKTFIVGSQPEAKTQKSAVKAVENHLGIGGFVNAFNFSAGPALVLWPVRNVGIQAFYGVGTFKTYDIRVLYRFSTTGGLNPYVGLGYLSAERDTNVLGVDTKFKSSSGEVCAGVDVPLSAHFSLFADVNANNMKLTKFVTNGSLSGTAEVKYSPVSFSAGIVYYLF